MPTATVFRSQEVGTVDYYQGILSPFTDKYLDGIKEGLKRKKDSEVEAVRGLISNRKGDYLKIHKRVLDTTNFDKELDDLTKKIDHFISGRIMTESRDEINKHVKEWAEKVVDAGNKKELTDVKLRGLIGELNQKTKGHGQKLIGEINQELAGFMKNLHWLNQIAGWSSSSGGSSDQVQPPSKTGESVEIIWRDVKVDKLDKYVSLFPQETGDVVAFDDVKDKFSLTLRITTWASCCQQRLRLCHQRGGSAGRIKNSSGPLNGGFWGMSTWSTFSNNSLGFAWGAY